MKLRVRSVSLRREASVDKGNGAGGAARGSDGSGDVDEDDGAADRVDDDDAQARGGEAWK